METFAALVEVNEESIQNVQELATVWGDIRNDAERLDGELTDAYALLGEHDFLVVFEAETRERAFQFSASMERYGLDTQTMSAIPVEDLGRLVDDV